MAYTGTKTAAFRTDTGTDTSGNLSFRAQVDTRFEILKTQVPTMHSHLFGGAHTMAKHDGTTIRVRRYLPIALDLTPLVEGETPTAGTMTYTDAQVTLRQFGRYVPFSDQLMTVHQDRIRPELVEKLGRNFAETMEVLNFIELTQGTTVRRGGGVESRDLIHTAVSVEDLQYCHRVLSRADARPISKVVAPTGLYGTEGVEPAYFAMCSDDLLFDLQALVGWVPYIKYANGGKRYVEGELGKWGSFRFIGNKYVTPDRLHLEGTAARLWTEAGAADGGFLSGGEAGTAAVEAGPENVPPAEPASNCDIYPIVIVGADAYACKKLAGYADLAIMAKEIDKPDSSDPLGQRGTLGWKAWQGLLITDQTAMVRLEVACSNSRDMTPIVRTIAVEA